MISWFSGRRNAGAAGIAIARGFSIAIRRSPPCADDVNACEVPGAKYQHLPRRQRVFRRSDFDLDFPLQGNEEQVLRETLRLQPLSGNVLVNDVQILEFRRDVFAEFHKVYYRPPPKPGRNGNHSACAVKSARISSNFVAEKPLCAASSRLSVGLLARRRPTSRVIASGRSMIRR